MSDKTYNSIHDNMGKKILLFEDNEDDLYLTKRTLERIGFNTFEHFRYMDDVITALKSHEQYYKFVLDNDGLRNSTSLREQNLGLEILRQMPTARLLDAYLISNVMSYSLKTEITELGAIPADKLDFDRSVCELFSTHALGNGCSY